jgi:hypothetical protein
MIEAGFPLQGTARSRSLNLLDPVAQYMRRIQGLSLFFPKGFNEDGTETLGTWYQRRIEITRSESTKNA